MDSRLDRTIRLILSPDTRLKRPVGFLLKENPAGPTHASKKEIDL